MRSLLPLLALAAGVDAAGVQELHAGNFDETLEQHPHVLVHFTARWSNSHRWVQVAPKTATKTGARKPKGAPRAREVAAMAACARMSAAYAPLFITSAPSEIAQRRQRTVVRL